MEEHAALLSMLTGPTSSLILLLTILYAVWKAVTQSIIPAVKAWVDKHLAQVDDLLESHGKDRDAWLKSMSDCSDQNKQLQGTLERVERKVGGLYARHEALQTRLDVVLSHSPTPPAGS
jgi:hypothetical protein